MQTRIAYVVNHYPKITHSFIRREIRALERQGFAVQRIALRGWQGHPVDEEDRQEQRITRYVLRGGVLRLLIPVIRVLLDRPCRFLGALLLAIRMGRHSDRPMPYHLIYFAEACCILRWISYFRASHVHAHFGTNSAEIVMLAHALGGPPFSFTVHGPEEFDRALLLGIVEKVSRSSFVIAISSHGRSQLYRYARHADWHKVKVVHCGLEPAFYLGKSAPVPADARLVCVGRMSEQKGQVLLVEAAARLARCNTDFELVLVGDGELRNVIEALIAARGLQHRVRITGWLSNAAVRQEILSARALVLPSFAEGLPVVIMEAMALGRPVISTYVAGIPELVRPGKDGWLVPAGSIEELAAAMRQALDSPVDVLRKMGEAAHRRIIERHSVDTEVTKLAALFRGSSA